jgi:hypothetical protein
LDGYQVQNLLNFDHSEWLNASDQSNSYIVIHFQNFQIKPSQYLHRSAYCAYPQGWIVEGSNDFQNWEHIDERSNLSCFIQWLQTGKFNYQSKDYAID